MNIKYRKASKLLNILLKQTLGRYLTARFNIEGRIRGIKNLKPPYMVLANHPGFWDPFILSIFIPESIYFVASDEYFRNPVLRFLLALTGAIPKSKFITDSEAVRGILHIRKNNGVIGIFPEGRRTWDGCTAPILYPTSKLVKKLGIPVVTAKIQGGFLSCPRWGKNGRRGKITVTYNLALSNEQIKNMSAGEIHSLITGHLSHNEYKHQRKLMIPFKGRNLAENIELFLFTCPQCKSLDTLHSLGATISCSCGFRAQINVYGFFKPVSGSIPFETPMEWNNWQQENLLNLLLSSPGNVPCLSNGDVTIESGERLVPFISKKRGELALYADKLVFTGENGKSHCYLPGEIKGLNVQYNDRFEFYTKKKLYRFSFDRENISAFKWTSAIEKVRKLDKIGREGMTNEL